jgi:hypothetical protein
VISYNDALANNFQAENIGDVKNMGNTIENLCIYMLK